MDSPFVPPSTARASSSRAVPASARPLRTGTSRAGTSRAGTSRAATSRTGRRTATASARRFTTSRKVEDEYVVAIIESNFAEVGLAAYNLTGFDVELRQIADSKTFSKLTTAVAVLNVIEIVLSLSSSNGALVNALNNYAATKDIKRTLISRSYFNETQGAIIVDRLSVERCPHLRNLENSPYYLALASCGALIRYIEHANNFVISPKSMRIRFKPNEGTLFLDMQTIEGLELLVNGKLTEQARAQRKKGSLLDAMDMTQTRPGRRMLRRSLLEPPSDLDYIRTRQDAMSELRRNEDLYLDLINVLKKFPDIERALSVLMRREKKNPIRSRGDFAGSAASVGDGSASEPPVNQKVIDDTRGPTMAIIRNVLILKEALELVVDLSSALRGTKSDLFVGTRRIIDLPVLGDLRDVIKETIRPEAATAKELDTMRLQGAFAVVDGRNGQLDVSRRILCDLLKSMTTHSEEIQNRFELAQVKLAITASRGYHLVMSNYSRTWRLPDEFVEVQVSGKMVRFTTAELDGYNKKYLEILDDIWKFSEVEVREILEAVFEPKNALALYFLNDAVAILDLISNFVTYASLSQVLMNRPKLTNNGLAPAFLLQNAHHPIIAHLNPMGSVPNSLISDEVSALQLVMGQNNAGKSTLLKMVGLLTIMAHSGCYIPAEKSLFMVMDSILSRFTSDDSITDGHSHSHFSKEMSEVAVILDSIEKNENDAIALLQGDGCNSTGSSSWADAVSTTNKFKKFIILVDELGRSTSILDGFSIAFAVLERFIATPGVFALCATHFHGLAALKVYPNVNVLHMRTRSPEEARQVHGASTSGMLSSTEPSGSERFSDRFTNCTEFTYKLVNGVLEGTAYGAETARSAGFPVEVVEEALKFRDQVSLRRIGDPDEFARVHFPSEAFRRSAVVKKQLIALRRVAQILQSNDAREAHEKLVAFQQDLRAEVESGSSTQGATETTSGDRFSRE